MRKIQIAVGLGLALMGCGESPKATPSGNAGAGGAEAGAGGMGGASTSTGGMGGAGGAGGAAPELQTIYGRFEAGGPVLTCGTVKDDWKSADGPLLRMALHVCGDDFDALGQTIVANLDAVKKRGGKALLILNQGINLPASWLAQCETFHLDSGNFQGDLCVPWDAKYQALLSAALKDHVGPAVAGHPALAGVYFTTTTMTNGAEMHFRVARSSFTPYPGQATFTGAYLKGMDMYQEAFHVPILFEAGHCIFDVPGAPASEVDCDTPLQLYRYARDTYGKSSVGLALWNCAERFWHGPTASEDHTRPLIEEATKDGVSMGCQTVANFTKQPCRFSDPAVGDYGTQVGMGAGATCDPSAAGNDAESACVDTLSWFAGVSSKSPTSVAIHGTWLESWSQDTAATGVNQTSAACKSAIDPFQAPSP